MLDGLNASRASQATFTATFFSTLLMPAFHFHILPLSLPLTQLVPPGSSIQAKLFLLPTTRRRCVNSIPLSVVVVLASGRVAVVVAAVSVGVVVGVGVWWLGAGGCVVAGAVMVSLRREGC